MRYSVNGIVISKSINDEYVSLENDRTVLEEMMSTYNLVSNIKAIESFGYKATEGLASVQSTIITKFIGLIKSCKTVLFIMKK